jgi:ribonuclease Z
MLASAVASMCVCVCVCVCTHIYVCVCVRTTPYTPYLSGSPAFSLSHHALSGVPCRRPENVFITHTHADHATDVLYMCLRPDGVSCYVPASATAAVQAYIRAGVELNNNAAFDESLCEYDLCGVRDGDMIRGLRGKRKDFVVRVFDCVHAVPCVGYAFSQTRKKLKQEYAALSGAEIGKLRRTGVDVTEEVAVPRFVYVGDTNVVVFKNQPWILEYPSMW